MVSLIMEIPSKPKDYLDNTRGSLPAVTDPDEPLHIDWLGVICLVAFWKVTWVFGLRTKNL